MPSGGEKFGLTSQQLNLLKTLVIEPLKKYGAQVWIFGSRARGDHRPASDVDILFEFPAEQDPPAGFLFSIKNDIEESRFPFTLDLVSLSNLAKSYRESVLKERRLL